MPLQLPLPAGLPPSPLLEEEEKQEVMFSYFNDLLGTALPRSSTLDLAFFHRADIDLSALDAPIIEEEVWDNIKLLPTDCAPGPDGYTGKFYKSCWSIIKEDFMAAIITLQQGDARKLWLLNSAYLTLIPKTDEELGGRLCCAHAWAPGFAVVDIWLATDDHDGDGEDGACCLVWSVAYRVELLRPVKNFVLPLVVSGDGDELLLAVDRRMLYRYSARKRALERVVDMQRAPDLYGAPKPQLPLLFLHHAVPHVESLLSIHTRNY